MHELSGLYLKFEFLFGVSVDGRWILSGRRRAGGINCWTFAGYIYAAIGAELHEQWHPEFVSCFVLFSVLNSERIYLKSRRGSVDHMVEAILALKK
jgi:hypothetical protein